MTKWGIARGKIYVYDPWYHPWFSIYPPQISHLWFSIAKCWVYHQSLSLAPLLRCDLNPQPPPASVLRLDRKSSKHWSWPDPGGGFPKLAADWGSPGSKNPRGEFFNTFLRSWYVMILVTINVMINFIQKYVMYRPFVGLIDWPIFTPHVPSMSSMTKTE